MNIKPFSVKIIDRPTTPIDSSKLLERIGRLCWASEDKISEESYKKFLTMIYNRGHHSVFEHIWLKLPLEYLKTFLGKPRFSFISDNSLHVNLRTLIDNYNRDCGSDIKELLNWYWVRLQKEMGLSLQIPEEKQDNEFFCFEPSDEVITILVECNRGISHQLVRHRDFFSYTQQSTRFIDFTKKGGGVTYIQQLDFNEWDETEHDNWIMSMRTNEIEYIDAIDRGKKPGEARNYLNHYTATKLYITSNLSGWKHYIQERRKGGQAEHQIICDVLESNMLFG